MGSKRSGHRHRLTLALPHPATSATVNAGTVTPSKPGTLKVNAAYTEQGITKTSDPATLEVLCRDYTQYRQDVGWWASQLYAYHKPPYNVPPPLAIGDVGCLLTSVAMLISSTGGAKMNPGTLDTNMTNWKLHDNQNGVKPELVVPFFSGYQIQSVKYGGYDPTSWINELDNCNVIIAHLPSASGRDHYVMVIGHHNGQWVAYDPLSSGETSISQNQTIYGGYVCKF